MKLFISHNIDGRDPRPIDLTCTKDLRALFTATVQAVYDNRPEDPETGLAIEAWAADNGDLAQLPDYLDEAFIQRIRDELLDELAENAQPVEPEYREHALSAAQLGVKTGAAK